ncbi:major capsid protein [Shouchella miscanthi]|uniref:major capsid protein n=1 Tax=Shouchella miscanthi TaxID=2598861 RepID=UPI0011A1888F|nr:major capsid protein [Shouchella miscanthi]
MAGITHLEEFQSEALRGLVDASAEDVQATEADSFLPTRQTYDRKFAYQIVKNTPQIGAYIGYGAEPPVVDRNAVASMADEIAYYGLKDIVTYEELQAINESRNNQEFQAMIDTLVSKGVNLIDSLRKLQQLSKMEALCTGAHAYKKNNVSYTINYGIPEENKIALTNGNDFDSDDFDMIGFLLEQVEAYAFENNGKEPEVMWISREINAKMLRNTNIIAESGRPSNSLRVSNEELATVLDNFGLPPVQIIKNRSMTYKDIYTGEIVNHEFMPVNRIVMLSQGVGEYLEGPTLENNFQPGLFLDAYDKKEPIQSIFRAVGAGLPILEVPSLVRHLDVFTP